MYAMIGQTAAGAVQCSRPLVVVLDLRVRKQALERGDNLHAVSARVSISH